MSEELKKAILDYFEKNSAKGKKRMSPKDVTKGLSDQFERVAVKKVVQELLDSGELAIWSSGSTTYWMLKRDQEEQDAKERGQAQE
jgi:hypothetical protein